MHIHVIVNTALKKKIGLNDQKHKLTLQTGWSVLCSGCSVFSCSPLVNLWPSTSKQQLKNKHKLSVQTWGLESEKTCIEKHKKWEESLRMKFSSGGTPAPQSFTLCSRRYEPIRANTSTKFYTQASVKYFSLQ